MAPLRPTPGNAAFELRNLELGSPARGSTRRSTALFGLSSSLVDTMLKHFLCKTVPAAEVQNYSFHSARIELACALLKSNATTAQIQRLCRWRSEESAKIYARMEPAVYCTLIENAFEVDTSSIRTTHLPRLHSHPDMTAVATLVQHQ